MFCRLVEHAISGESDIFHHALGFEGKLKRSELEELRDKNVKIHMNPEEVRFDAEDFKEKVEE